MVVLLTVGVSVASRSVSELKLSRQEQESTRALDMAESGIEDLLSENLATLSPSTGERSIPGGGGSYTYAVTAQNGLSNIAVARGHTVDVKLYDATLPAPKSTDAIIIDWESGDCTAGSEDEAAIEVSIITLNTGTYGVRRAAFDNCGDRRSGANPNNFSAPTPPGTITSVALTPNDLMARIKVVYSPTVITGVTVSSTSTPPYSLPTQYYTVRSAASVEGVTTRAVTVDRLAFLPSIFDYVVFSGNTIVKP